MSQAAGLWMLLAVAVFLIVTGLPAWILLIGVATGAAAIGVVCGSFGVDVLTALPIRIIGLLENDLLQALPLYALMGALLNRLALAEIWLRAGRRLLRRSASASELSSVGLGVLLAPMNGSVGASVAMLGRVLLPRLEAEVGHEPAAALVCVASTLGVVVPPSLVLVLLGDAMMRAHTEAINASGGLVRIINTQDVFHAVLPAAAILLVLITAIAWWNGRTAARQEASNEALTPGTWISAAVTALFVLTLLVLVATGRLYAVEAAAAGGVALFAFGLVTGALRRAVLVDVLHDTLALTGALFALLIGATTFTLVVRSFGTDRWVAEIFAGLGGGGQMLPLTVGMAILIVCALVLDAFEIIFVVVPVVMPAVLMAVPDATWVAVLTLLVLQLSFLLPPLGYALLMVRNYAGRALAMRRLVKALAPFIVAQLAVLVLVLAWPELVSSGPESRQAPAATDGAADDDLATQLRRQRDP